MLVRLRHKWLGVRHTAVAGAAGDCVGCFVIGELREVFGVEVVGHLDHQARLVFDRIGIGGEVHFFGFGISGMAELAFDTEVALILMHCFHDFVAGDVPGESFDVGWIGTRASRRSRCSGLGGRCGGGGLLCPCGGRR